MKYFVLVFLTILSTTLNAQINKPTTISVSYFGETITHPGLKIGFEYHIKSWNKTGNKKVIHKNINLNPSIGFFYHKNYQTGLFVSPELSYSRKNTKGNFIAYAIGAGYMRTFISNVFDFNLNGEIKKIHTGYNYFITNYLIAFGKELIINKTISLSIYIKPQLMYAIPNFSKGIVYFASELGVVYSLPKIEIK